MEGHMLKLQNTHIVVLIVLKETVLGCGTKVHTQESKHICEPLAIHLSMLTGTRGQFKSEVGSSKLLLPLGRDTMLSVQSSLLRVEVT